jgi:hypothetical protein
MNNRRRLILGISILFVLAYMYDCVIPKATVIGTYVSKSKEPMADGPHYGDTLVLLENNNFQSDTWGNGTYEIEYTLNRTRINLTYDSGKAYYSSYFYRPFFIGPHRIKVSRDLNYYFERID